MREAVREGVELLDSWLVGEIIPYISIIREPVYRIENKPVPQVFGIFDKMTVNFCFLPLKSKTSCEQQTRIRIFPIPETF